MQGHGKRWEGSARLTQHLPRVLQDDRHVLVRGHETEVAYVHNVIPLPPCLWNRRRDVQRRKRDILRARGWMCELRGGYVQAVDLDVSLGIQWEGASEVDRPNTGYVVSHYYAKWTIVRRGCQYGILCQLGDE